MNLAYKIAILTEMCCNFRQSLQTNVVAYIGKSKSKVHPCAGTEAVYRPYGP